MSYILVGAVGLLLGLACQDLAFQSLTEGKALRPFQGTCRSCGHQRGWRLVRCPACGTSTAREWVVALGSGVVAAGFAHTVGFGWILLPYLAFLGLTVALLITDLEAFRIVDRLNLRGSALVTVLLVGAVALAADWGSLWRALGGAAAYFLGALALYIIVGGRGFGAGDVKLAYQLGLFTAFLGWGVLGWAVFATAMIGGVLAVVALVAGGASRKTELPYGPPMILGAWTAIVLVGVGAIPIPS